MEILRDKASMRGAATAVQGRGGRIGFVPTMGALHAGHLSLLDEARRGTDVVVASVFVNPMQFGPDEDCSRYPRDLEGDARALAAAGCDLLFAPEASDMYAPDARTVVEVRELQDVLCGRTRPGHFRGVATVVAKLFHIVQPQVAVFGQKDAQQAVILRRMGRDLDLPVEIRAAPIVRDPDGLALSSRNAYLGAAERAEALLLHEALAAGGEVLRSGERRTAAVTAPVRAVLQRGRRLRIDYAELVDAADLRPQDAVGGKTLLAVAAFIGSTRLIDNVVFDVRSDSVREVALFA